MPSLIAASAGRIAFPKGFLQSEKQVHMDKKKEVSGIGIHNIKNQLDLFNGMATMSTSPGEGFTLEITIPLK